MKQYISLSLLVWFAISSAFAGEVTVSEAWARATAPGQQSAAVSMRIVSPKDASIVAVTSKASRSAEIHSMTEENGMMQMRELAALPLQAKREVTLGNDGNHLMLVGLKKPLKEGDAVALTITVQFADKRKEKVLVSATVRSLTASRDEHMQH